MAIVGAISKTSSYKWKVIVLLFFLTMCIGGTGILSVGSERWEKINAQEVSVPFILNSGMVRAQEADVRVIVWFENIRVPDEIWTQGPLPDWRWTTREQQTVDGKTAVTLFGEGHLDKNEEKRIYTWYNSMSLFVANKGGRLYLDERVPEVTDISAYMSRVNAQPAQWSLSGQTFSIAAYQKALHTSVVAGHDRINFQLLSRGEKGKGLTVLAIPALLEEF